MQQQALHVGDESADIAAASSDDKEDARTEASSAASADVEGNSHRREGLQPEPPGADVVRHVSNRSAYQARILWWRSYGFADCGRRSLHLGTEPRWAAWNWLEEGNGSRWVSRPVNGKYDRRLTFVVFQRTPTLLISINDRRMVEIACGPDYSIALDSTGRLWGWGRNNFGQVCFFLFSL